MIEEFKSQAVALRRRFGAAGFLKSNMRYYDFEKLKSRIAALRNWFNDLSLVRQFVLAGSIVLLIGMTIIGRWVAAQIETSVVNNTSATTALYMNAVLAPVVQQVTSGEEVGPDAQQRIDDVLKRTALGKQIVSIKIWARGGLIAYSTRKELVGKRFEESIHLQEAWSGVVSAEFDSLNDDEDAIERESGLALLEMYMPVRDKTTGEIIAVAEFYSVGELLHSDLGMAFRRSWMLVGLVTLAMMAALFGIVRRGNRTIDAQRQSAEGQVVQLKTLLDQNERLRKHVQQAYSRAEGLKESFLRRVGADLHDGPAQLVGLALLRLDSLRPSGGARSGSMGREDASFDVVQDTLKEALREIRKQSAGLALPELDDADARKAIELAIRGHEQRTETEVKRLIEIPEERLPQDVTVCLYRFVQEGLNNSFRHANGEGQEVSAKSTANGILLEVSDRGLEPVEQSPVDGGHGIGLVALRDRVETLGGEFDFSPRPGGGSRLSARFNYDKLEANHV